MCFYSMVKRNRVDGSHAGLHSCQGMLRSSPIYNTSLTAAQCMVVDDRIVVIGSANINERSQRGDRDSELACVIRDTDMIDSRMAGKPYKVGRFGRSLRIRLMREHLGVDTDGELNAAR